MPKKISPYLVILIAFLSVILIGSVLLVLPISSKPGVHLSYVDAFFTATSAICVTGLSTINVQSTLSAFGKIVLLILIQVGGLGLVTIGIFFLSMLGFQFGVKERVLIKESLNQNNLSGLVRLVKTIFLITVIIEVVGAIINMFVFVPEMGFWKGLGVSIFHSVSSFNNAGFDIFVGESLRAYQNNVLLLLNTSFLIIAGGIGFVVILDIVNFRKTHRFSIHTKIVVITTFMLLLLGTVIFKFTTPSLSWLDAYFQSVSVRTAGFNSIDMSSLNDSTVLAMDIFMFIGCSPVSTGGGIKTTTLFVVILSIYSFATGKPCIAFKRKISDKYVLKAFWVVALSASFIIFMSFCILCLSDFGIKEVTFECFSAFATVGLSLGITGNLNVICKLILCVGMFFGRLGPLTIASLFNTRWNKDTEGSIKYVEEKIMIG